MIKFIIIKLIFHQVIPCIKNINKKILILINFVNILLTFTHMFSKLQIC